MEINENGTLEKIEDGTLPLTDDEAESVTGGESQVVQAWRRVATGEGRPVQIGNKGVKHSGIFNYSGWIAAKCPNCGHAEAMFASDKIVYQARSHKQSTFITFQNCKCYICDSVWNRLCLDDITYDGSVGVTSR
jgi:ribosomal protein L32